MLRNEHQQTTPNTACPLWLYHTCLCAWFSSKHLMEVSSQDKVNWAEAWETTAFTARKKGLLRKCTEIQDAGRKYGLRHIFFYNLYPAGYSFVAAEKGNRGHFKGLSLLWWLHIWLSCSITVSPGRMAVPLKYIRVAWPWWQSILGLHSSVKSWLSVSVTEMTASTTSELQRVIWIISPTPQPEDGKLSMQLMSVLCI